MRIGIIRLMANIELLKLRSITFQKHLDKLRSKVIDAFSNIPIPGNHFYLIFTLFFFFFFLHRIFIKIIKESISYKDLIHYKIMCIIYCKIFF